MDEITKLKAEAYDIVARIQQLQRLLEEKNKQIVVALEQQTHIQTNQIKRPVSKKQ